MASIILANGEGGVGMPTAIRESSNRSSALDVVERAIREVEMDATVRTVGFGGAPNILGQMECDAAIMCGASLRCGAVGALRNYLHSISVARQVMERTPHTMLVGEGASLFAAEIGLPQSDILDPQARVDYETWINQHVPREILLQWPKVALTELVWRSAHPTTARGTTCFLVRTNDLNFAGGTSTSGWAYKYPGRLGDSPIVGAGLYVDNRWGACACTHTGEVSIRAGTARAVIAYMKKGASVQEAVHEALDDIAALQGGHKGPLVVHAMDRDGTPYVAYVGDIEPPRFWLWREELNETQFPEAAKH